MKYVVSQLVTENKKKCIKILETILKLQNESVERMLDVVKSDCQNKLKINSILGPPTLEEWKSVYTKLGWDYIEAEQMFVDPVPRTLPTLFSKSGKEIFPREGKKEQYHPNAFYDEMVGNYETYKFCKREHYETFDVIRSIEPIRENLDFLDYEYIEHDEALCFLLGINANLPSSLSLSDEKLITVLNYEDDPYDQNVNNFLFKSKQNKKLLRKFGTPTINTKEFIEWTLEQGYIEEANKDYLRNLNDDPYEKEFSELLYKELMDRSLISGEYYEKWQWRTNFNSLHFLIKSLWLNTIPIKWYARYPEKDPSESRGPDWNEIMHYFYYPENKTDIRQQVPKGAVAKEAEIENIIDLLLDIDNPNAERVFFS